VTTTGGGIVAVIGNPKAGSRTKQAAELVATRLTDRPPDHVIELSALGPALLGWGDPSVEEAKRHVLAADLLIIASPTYKATYTGLLKLFLEQFKAGEIPATPTVALMLGGAPHHALAPELTLKPVLSEIGCSCPFPGLYLIDSEWSSGPPLDDWAARARRTRRLL
jgi:FMN reductase